MEHTESKTPTLWMLALILLGIAGPASLILDAPGWIGILIVAGSLVSYRGYVRSARKGADRR